MKRSPYTADIIEAKAARSRKLKIERESEFAVSILFQEWENGYKLYVCADSATLKGAEVKFENATFSELQGRLSLPEDEHTWYDTLSLPLTSLDIGTAIGIDW